MSVVIETTIGDITVDLYLKERPNACLNFLKLCKIKYYNLCVFHKVERNFIAQTGDPTSTGRGGESVFASLYGDQAKYFEAEIKPRLKHEKLGTLSMVNNGNNMNGSQFFITLAENLTYLDEVHTVFGEVAEGFEILLKLNEAICDPNNRPFQDIRITHTVVLHDPYDDPPGLEIPDASPEPTKEMLETDYIAADEEIDDTKGKNVEEIEEKIKDSEAKARATILEMVGDIPDADVKPPEDVLFVCKLNPVTTSEDLELIFSRFGPIVSCEVIKDKKSGESLQYAFIEFEKEEDCENAYFKMDNVLIDDRRIHVDFSQSVSKLNWDMENKSSRDKSNKQQNLVFKDKEKKSDGYEMIFDIDTDSKHSKSDHKEQYQSKLSSTKEHHSHKSHDRHRSPDSPPRRSHSDNYHTSKQSSKSKDSSNYSRSRQKFSRSPSYLKSRSFRHSRSPSRSHFSKTSSQQLNRKYTYHDSRSSSASSYEQKPTSYKRKHHSPQHHHKRTMIKPSHSTDREKDENPSYYESSRSHSSIYSKHKYSSRKRSKSPHKKRSRTPVSSPSHSVPPKRYGSEKTSYSTEFIKHSKKSSRNSSKSTSPQYRKYQKKVSSNSKHVSLKNSKEYKKSKINSDSSDSPQYSESQKKVSSKYGSLKNSKEHKKHKKSKSDSDSSESSDDSRTDVNRTEIKSKSISSHTEYSKHKYSHKTKHHKHSSR